MKELVCSTPIVDEADLLARTATAALEIQKKEGISFRVRDAMARRVDA